MQHIYKISHHLLLLPITMRDVLMSCFAICTITEREGASEIGRPHETFRKKADVQSAVVSVSKMI